MNNILVVEDEPIILSNIGEILSLVGYVPTMMPDGMAALEYLQGQIKEKKNLPALILCDLMMPRLDGYELLERVRSTPELAKTPFVVLSAKSAPEDFSKAFALGASEYMVKPFEVELLIEVVSGLMAKRS